MTFVRKNKFWFWFITALMIMTPMFVGAATHFTKQAGVSSADDLTTSELDTTLHLTPDGAEGVQWTSPVAPVADDLTTVDTDQTKRLAPDGAGGVEWTSGISEGLTSVSTATYTIDDANIRNLAFDSRLTAITVTIDSDWIAVAGNFIRVKDWYYSADTNNITFLTEGLETIDLETDAIMGSGGQAGQAWTFITDGSNIGVF